MINKKNLWFLTLFSLVLVLSIYYVTMPSEIFDSKLENEKVDKSTVNVEESSVISALKVEDENEVKEKINGLKEKLTNSEVSTKEKNSSKEETLESKIKDSCSCENFVKIDGDNVRVVLDSDDSNATTANNIMRLVQKEFDDKMYISVKFNK